MKQRYDSYKDSGVEWIGRVPSHWKVAPFKWSMSINNGCDYKHIETENGYPVMGSGGIFTYASDFLYDGEVLLLGRKGTIDKPMYFKGRFWTVDTMFYAIPNIKTCCRYMYYQALGFPYSYYSTATALPSMAASDLANNPIAIPPLAEQEAIAAWLDEKCGEVDKVIEGEKRRITLLEELKQSVITEAVTHGLNPDATLKPSGVDGIGDIPEHWEVRKMRYLCSITTGDKDTVNRVEDGLYPFYVRSPQIERINSYSFDGEAILMAGDGVGAGKVIHYANCKFDYHQRVYNIHNFNEVMGKFLFSYLRVNFKYKIEEGGAKNTVDSVRLPWLKDFPVTIPPLAEQQTIVDYLDTKCGAIDADIAKTKRKIELLQEYKQSLITEAVTGKRKVI